MASTAVYDGVIYDHNNQYEQDSKLFVQFFTEAVQNNFKSQEAGRPIFDEIDMVRIMTPGARDVLVTKATYQYQSRFPRQYALFKAGKEQTVEGTPLSEVPFLSVGQIAELKAMNVHTLEQLADMPDVQAQKFMGSFSLRQRAKNLIDAAKENAPMERLQAELEKRDVEIETLKQQLADVINRLPKATP